MHRRIRASLIHLAISAAVVAAAGAFLYFKLYPGPLFASTGALGIFALVALVDVFIGPFLTLCVYDERKRELKYDLAAIAALQVAAFIFGSYHLFEARPVYVAALSDRFHVALGSEVSDVYLDKAGTRRPLFGPQWVATREPSGLEEEIAVSDLESLGSGAGHLPTMHVPLEAAEPKLLQHAKRLTSIAFEREERQRLERMAKRMNTDFDALRYLPARIAHNQYVAVLVDPSGHIIPTLTSIRVPSPPPLVPRTVNVPRRNADTKSQ